MSRSFFPLWGVSTRGNGYMQRKFQTALRGETDMDPALIYSTISLLTDAEILVYPYRRQVPLPRIPNNRAQESTRDPAHPSIQTFITLVQTKLCQQKPEQSFAQLQWQTYVLNSYTNICAQ